MQLDLKKVTFSEAISEETSAFTADVYLDGKLVATARNTGQGGSTDVRAAIRSAAADDTAGQLAQVRANREVMARYEAWAKEQPNTQVGVHDWAPAGFTRSLEADVDAAFEAWLTEHCAKKEQARLKRLCKNQWVFTLREYKGKPTDPNAIFTLPRVATQQVKVVGQQLREKYGTNLKELLNEVYG